MGIARIGFIVLFIFSVAVSAQAAQEFAVQVTGQIQGQFKGESTRKGFENKFMGLSFDQEVVSPRDTATGQATGKRTFKPIRIKKAWGPASLQLYACIVQLVSCLPHAAHMAGCYIKDAARLDQRLRCHELASVVQDGC